MSFETDIWLFPLVTTLHNLEEAIWLPEWRPPFRLWRLPGRRVFAFAAGVLTVLAYAGTWLSTRAGGQSAWTYFVFGYMVAMLANALLPHLLVTLVTRRYMPGAGTAAVLILPVLSMLVIRALREHQVSGWRALESAVVVPLLLLFSIPALCALGRAMRL